MAKSSKTYYMQERHIKLADRLAEKYAVRPSRVIELAIERVNEEGLRIPAIRSGKRGLKR